MIDPRTIAATAIAAFCIAPIPVAGSEMPQIPASPSSVVATRPPADGGGPSTSSNSGNAAAAKPSPSDRGQSQAGTSKPSSGGDQTIEPTTLTVKPGVTEVLPIAKDHLNRIVTPYTDPQVRTTANAKIEVQDQVVYVASKSDAPITAYIMPSDSEAQALSLALVPRQVPPAEITLQLADHQTGGPARPADPAAARDWEQSQPYIESIEKLMAGLARGQVPSGYGLGALTQEMWHPDCKAPAGGDLAYDFVGVGQRVSGGSLIAYIGRVTNADDQPIELDERWCAGAGVVATAFWPRIILEPGQQAEVYVVRRRPTQPSTPQRPSLLEQ